MSSKRIRYSWRTIGGIVLAVVFSLAWVFPLFWAVDTAFKDETQTLAMPPTWIPHPITLGSFKEVLSLGGLPQWYFNSAVTAIVITVFVIVLSSAAAYAFSQLWFPGKTALFWLVMAGIMVPFESLLVPLFMLMNWLEVVNTYGGIVLPQLVAPVVLFVLKRFFDQVPRELREAALIDGAGDLRILTHIFVPTSKNVMWVLAIVTFIGAWNNFLWPFIITTSPGMMTIPVGLTQVQSSYGVRYAAIMASATLAALPIVVGYVLFQRRVTEGVITMAGLKG